MAERDYAKEIDALKGDLTAVRNDLQTLLKSVADDQREYGHETVQRIQDTVNEARGEINRLAREAGARGREGVTAVEHQIEERPFTSVIAAFGIGIVIGKLLDR